MSYVIVVVGVALLAASAAAWLGHWRRWTRTFITAHLPAPITILPALGALLVTFGLHDVSPFPGSSFLAGAALVGGLVAVVLALWDPPWFGPAWFREVKASGPVEPDLTDPLTASTYAMSRGDVDPRAPVARRFGDSKPLERWRVSLVDGSAKVGGHLELHQGGLAFYPNEMEARMREDAFSLMLEPADVGAVRSAGGTAFEIETRDGSVHRFEAFFPGRIVERIQGAG